MSESQGRAEIVVSSPAIIIEFEDQAEAQRTYDAIEHLLITRGGHGTLWSIGIVPTGEHP